MAKQIVFVVLVSGLLWMIRPQVGQVEVTESKRQDFLSAAHGFLAQGRFEDCLYELSLLHDYSQIPFGDSREVETSCLSGMQAEISHDVRAPASVIDSSAPAQVFVQEVCAGPLYRGFERMYAIPEMPTVRDLNSEILALSRKLHDQFEARTAAAGQLAKEIRAFCARNSSG